jgi:hypothetical protein
MTLLFTGIAICRLVFRAVIGVWSSMMTSYPQNGLDFFL